MEYFAFQWHITDECDQRCKHCYIFAEDACKQLDAMTWPQRSTTACPTSTSPAATPSCTPPFGTCWD